MEILLAGDGEVEKVLREREDIGFSVDESGEFPHIAITPQSLKKLSLKQQIERNKFFD